MFQYFLRYKWLCIAASVALIGGVVIVIVIYNNFYNGLPGWHTYQGRVSELDLGKMYTASGEPTADPSDQQTWIPVKVKLANPIRGKWQACFVNGATVKCNARRLEANATVEMAVGRGDLVVFGFDENGNQLMLQLSSDPADYNL